MNFCIRLSQPTFGWEFNRNASKNVPANTGLYGAWRNSAGELTVVSICSDQARSSGAANKEPPMDWNRVEGNWKQMMGKVKEQWGKLTNDDLTAINGKRDQLEGKIQERYGLQKDIARKQIDDWYAGQSF
jgi:uncharacterized protein YjbJ (UPF0337 family)